MMRTLVLVLACVLWAAPAADAKKPRRPHASKRVAKSKKSKKALAMVHKAPPPTRVAAAEQHPAPPPEVSTPTPAATPSIAPAPSPPVEHGPLGPQAGDDEVPGTRMKR
jgi:hypothetical protein